METKKLWSLICKISILVLVVILAIVLCVKIKTSATSKTEFEPKCGEFYEVEYARSGSEQMPFAEEFRHYLDAYKINDTDEMEKTLNSMKSVQIDDTDMLEAVTRIDVKTLV